MPLKRFTGATATEALSRARREAGKDALIVATRTLAGPATAGRGGAARYEVLVAHEEDGAVATIEVPVPASTGGIPPALADARPRPASGLAVVPPPGAGLSDEVARVHRMLRRRMPAAGASHDTLSDDPATESIYRELRGTGLGASLTALVVSRVRPRLAAAEVNDREFVRSLIVAALADLLASEAAEISFGSGRRRLVLVGPPGAGKTTAIAKLGFHFALRRRRNVAIVSIDDAKAGASARIETLAAAAGIPFRAAGRAEDVSARLEEMADHDITLIDTAGTPAFGDAAAALAPLTALPGNAELYLVLSGAMAPALTRRVVDLYRPAGITGVILTMLDAAMPLGETVETLLTAGMPVAFLCRGAEVSDGVEVATAHRVAALVLQSARWDGNLPS